MRVKVVPKPAQVWQLVCAGTRTSVLTVPSQRLPTALLCYLPPCSMPVAAVKTYRKLSGLKYYKCILFQFWKSEVRNHCTGLKSMCKQSWFLLETLREAFVPLSFPASSVHLGSFAVTPKCIHHSNLRFPHHITFPSDCDSSCAPLVQTVVTTSDTPLHYSTISPAQLT